MLQTFMRLPLIAALRQEFAGYGWQTLQRDTMAGITVGAVALPLALAFGVASGATAAAGLVTAILSGIIIAGLGGGSFQISGPTGAMSAILILLAQRYGLQGVWVSSIIAGLLLVILGVFRFGRYISFVPSSVITGFTSGIALIIAIGEIDHVLGVTTPTAESALQKLLAYFIHPPTPDWRTLLLAGVVMVTMLILPRLTRAVPGSLVGLLLASLLAWVLKWQVPTIGTIPATILLDERLTWATIPWGNVQTLLSSAVAIAALGAIESLLCGSVGANMTGAPFDSNQELIGQGIGNIIIPFFGGVPATAAIARSSVAIKSGGVTRITSFVHSLVLLLSVFFLAPLIGQVPLAALGGVLMITAWRMNEWESIHFFTHRGVRHAMFGMVLTMLATIALDLTQAILIGIVISALIYLRQSSKSTSVTSAPVDAERIRATGHNLVTTSTTTHIYYLTGPLFFGSIHNVLEAFKTSTDYHTLIISMRGVPLVDATGVQAVLQITERQQHRGGLVCLSGLQPSVEKVFRQAGVLERVGEHNIFWGADQAIKTLDMRERSRLDGEHQVVLPFPAHLKVADVMTQDVYAVEPATPVSEVVTLLVDHALRCLPVIDEKRHVIGVISEGDLLRRGVINLSVAMKQFLPLPERAAAVLALESQGLVAKNLYTPNPVTIAQDAPLTEAARLMVQHTLKRLPVVDKNGCMVGILARSDLLNTVTETVLPPADTTITFGDRPPSLVGDIVERDVPVVQPSTPLVDVLDRILRSPHRRAVVLDGQAVVGLITDGDVLKRAARQIEYSALQRLMTWMKGDVLPTELHVAIQGRVAADVMTSRIITVQTTTPIIAAIQQLVADDVVGVPVVDEQQAFQGWIERSALLQALVRISTPVQGQQPEERTNPGTLQLQSDSAS